MIMLMRSATAIQIGEVWDAASVERVPALNSGAVHLWKRQLEVTTAEVDAYYQLLSNDERERALRFHIERPRRDFVVTRGTLRLLLAHYLENTPRDLRFRYEVQGKPVLDGEESLHFNVSHANGLALMAFVQRRAVGVDVENMGRETEASRLAKRFFSTQERAAIQRLRGDALQAAFFRCWTRKEAYIKAKGEGLALPLHQFDVSIAANDRDALLATRPDPAEVDKWMISDIPVGPGYVAAVAVATEECCGKVVTLKDLN
jgi:4'-phosphopantetheinyl transferase